MDMKRRIHEAEQYSRRECLEITGILNEISDRSLEKFIIDKIFRKLDVNINACNVSACHWLKNCRE